jgi:hypothetical protein
MRNASAKRRLKSNHFSNNLPYQNEYVLHNPINPVNPDSKIIYRKYAPKYNTSPLPNQMLV